LRRFGTALPKMIWAAPAAFFVLCACSAPSGPAKADGQGADPASVVPVSVAASPDADVLGAALAEDASADVAGLDAAADCDAIAGTPEAAAAGCLETDAAAKKMAAPTPEFDFEDVRQKAKRLSEQDYDGRDDLAKSAAELNYDQYRRIQNRPASTIWPESANGFRVLLDPRGYLFTREVRINLVEEGDPKLRRYAASEFDFQDLPLSEKIKGSLGYAGFRVLTVLNQAGKFDELVSFKGASFFRALGAGTVYGASARGLSIGTASAEGEEFPYFTEFWLVKPTSASPAITVYALMDGESVTGAFEFRITPGPETRIEVSAAFFPRREITSVGISPLTSMYFFSPHDLRKEAEDFRPAVHDSEGLQIRMKNGEWVWRPLVNPQSLQISVLATELPRGFGLIQRKRDLAAYADVEAEYHHRPNVWVQPTSNWGDGHLALVEIPTANEYNDNVVVFWKPEAAWQPGRAYDLSYNMRWSLRPPAVSSVIPIAETRSGKTPDKKRQLFVIDYEPAEEALLNNASASISTSNGTIHNPVVKRHPETGKTRLSFELSTENADVAELRALLTKGGKPVSETWLYRWRPE